MLKFISRYGTAAHLALVAVAPLFLFPFCSATTMGHVLLWLAAGTMAWVVLEPSRRQGEALHDARVRVTRNIVKDPLLWFLLAVILFAGLRAFNGGIDKVFDLELEDWRVAESIWPNFPGCATGAGYLPFAMVFALMVVVMACRHSLGKSARISFLFTTSFLAGLSGILAAFMCSFENPVLRAATEESFRNPTYWGSAFGVYFLVSFVAFVGGFDRKWNRLFMLFVFGMGGTATGLFFFAPMAVVLTYVIAGFLVMLCAFVFAGVYMGGSVPLKALAGFLMALVIPVLLVLGCAPDGMVASRGTLFTGGTLLPEGFSEVRGLLNDLSIKVLKGNLWIGTGLGTMGLNIRFNLNEADWSVVSPQQIALANGWLQFMVERGVVGMLIFVSGAGLLVYTYIRRMIVSFGKVYFKPAAWLGLAVLIVAVFETCWDNSLFNPAMFLAVSSIFAVSASSFPTLPTKSVASNEKVSEKVEEPSNKESAKTI